MELVFSTTGSSGRQVVDIEMLKMYDWTVGSQGGVDRIKAPFHEPMNHAEERDKTAYDQKIFSIDL